LGIHLKNICEYGIIIIYIFQYVDVIRRPVKFCRNGPENVFLHRIQGSFHRIPFGGEAGAAVKTVKIEGWKL